MASIISVSLSINIDRRLKVYAALPVLDEQANLPVIIHDLLQQQEVEFHLIICVNQPDEWWNIPEKEHICEHNRATLNYINSLNNEKITCIDRSSRGNGWIGRKHGVGWARKVAMDTAALMADDEDIIVSVDADTSYSPDFFKAVVSAIEKHPSAVGLSVPYYHPLTGNDIADSCILRYELYMRNYALNMLLIKNPYCFSAIGSGMACKTATYKKVRGLTPKLSGEDFYFIQKLRKAGHIIIDCEEVIYPASRFSDRVYFGTGPAMIRGRAGNWSSYPIYDQDLFLEIKATFDLMPELYESEVSTPMDTFLAESFQTSINDVWEPLRVNSPNVDQFVKAAIQKIDGLRILQYLKSSDIQYSESNESRLMKFIANNFIVDAEIIECLDHVCEAGFAHTPVNKLNMIRDFMFVNERRLQQKLQMA